MFVDYNILANPLPGYAPRLEKIYCLNADSSYRVNHTPFPKGAYLFLCVTAGNGYLGYQEQSFLLAQGDTLIMCPDETSFDYYTVGDRWSFWWFEFFAEIPPEGIGIKRQMFMDSFLTRLCENCFHYHKQGESVFASSMFAALLSEASAKIKEFQERDIRHGYFRQAQFYIQQNLPTVSVSGVAKYIGMGERALRNLFQDFTEQAPKEYILSVKIETACYLLESTTKSIREISEMLGFSSQFHFSQVFKERKQIPPSEFRKTACGKQ